MSALASLQFSREIDNSRRNGMTCWGRTTALAYSSVRTALRSEASVSNRQPRHGGVVAEVGYFVAPGFWDEGYASQALALVREYALAERRLNNLYAKTLTTNPASSRVLEKNGFQQDGVIREEGFTDRNHVDLLRDGLLARERSGELPCEYRLAHRCIHNQPEDGSR